jgi:hypothetical protein
MMEVRGFRWQILIIELQIFLCFTGMVSELLCCAEIAEKNEQGKLTPNSGSQGLVSASQNCWNENPTKETRVNNQKKDT